MLSVATICLALNVFYEARGESVKGQYAVAHVTLNRASNEVNNPSKVCGTVFKSGQFSWTKHHKNPLQRYVKISMMAKKKDEESWSRALDIAYKVISNKSRDITKGATYFNERKMGRKHKTIVVAQVIGKHIFY